MTTAAPEKDPLETYESLPAISFHPPNGGHPMGEWAKLEVRDWPKLLEQKDEDNNVERWDNGDAKLVLVVPVFEGVGEDGKPAQKNLWAKKFGKKAQGSLYQQLVNAQKKVRKDIDDDTYRLGPGDTVAVKWVSDDRSAKPIKGNYPKVYAAVIKPGQRPATTEDPLDEPQASEEDPFSTPQADAAETAASPAAVGADPFGPADAGDDEPPFLHRTGWDVGLHRGDVIAV